MSLRPADLLSELLELEARVRALRLRVEAAEVAEASSGARTSPSAAAESAELWSADWIAQLRQAVTPELLALVDLSPLLTLRGAGQLGTIPPNWTGADRLARAFRSGVLALARLDSGDFRLPPATTFYSGDKYHIVLFCPEKPAGFWSARSRPFVNYIGDPTGRGGRMARRAVKDGALTAEAIQAAIQAGDKPRASAAILTDSPTNSATWRSQTFLVKFREHGFLAIFPNLPEITETLNAFVVGAGEESVILSDVIVDMVSVRGRELAPCSVLLADLPWSYLSLFRAGPGKRHLKLLNFAVDDVAARPVAGSVDDAAAAWIHTMLSPDTADEYASAFEVAPEDIDGEPLSDPAVERLAGQPQAAEIFELQTKVAELQSLLEAQRVGSHQHGGAEGSVQRSAAPGIFDQGAGPRSLSAAELDRLQLVAGPAPRRLGRTEALPGQPAGLPALADQVLGAEEDRGVIDLETEQQQLANEVMASMGASSDPLQKMLLLQLRQTTELVKTLAGKQQAHQDPLAAMLAGSDNASGSSGGSGISVKGLAAREMFLKQLQDDAKIVEIIRTNARAELGLTSAANDGSLLKQYLEQRIPVGDHQTFAQMGYILASGWEIGWNSSNLSLMAFAGRMMIYIEQACLDSGRTSLAWLLTGLPEPNFQQLQLNRKRSTLTPFSRLAPAAWVGANVGYLKDVELFETKLRTLGIAKQPNQPSNPDSEDRETKPKPKAKKPKGGKGAKGEAGAEASQTTS
eukprot:Skav231248  [mRNA]  locus=scaffold411:263484:265801:+ [translate_table: standard]